MTLSPPSDQRLQDIQAELARRGVQTVGVTLTPGVRALPLDDVKSQAADAFEAFLDGRLRPLTDFGDPEPAQA